MKKETLAELVERFTLHSKPEEVNFLALCDYVASWNHDKKISTPLTIRRYFSGKLKEETIIKLKDLLKEVTS